MSASRFIAALETDYPDLCRALLLADDLVGNREVGVLDVLCASADEAKRAQDALGGAFGDLRAAIANFQDNAPRDEAKAAIQMGVHVTSVLLRVLELGCWLGQERLMSLKDKAIRHRLEEIARAGKSREALP